MPEQMEQFWFDFQNHLSDRNNPPKGSENKKMSEGPIYKYRVGAVTASVWKNTVKTKEAEYDNFSVTLQRSYKDKEGEWKNTDSLNVNDVPKARLALAKAFEYMNKTNEDE